MSNFQENLRIDDVDGRIISALGSDSRRSYSDVGAEVGLSTAAVHERVKKMLERGVIQRFSLQVDHDAVGLNFTAFVAIRNDGGAHCREIAPRLREISAVQELHSVAGEYDFLAKVRPCARPGRGTSPDQIDPRRGAHHQHGGAQYRV
jgi:Lrp/AsnC family leucine-responsive transcriptional regulator